MPFKSIERHNEYHRENMRKVMKNDRERYNAMCLIRNKRRQAFLKEFMRLSNILI